MFGNTQKTFKDDKNKNSKNVYKYIISKDTTLLKQQGTEHLVKFFRYMMNLEQAVDTQTKDIVAIKKVY